MCTKKNHKKIRRKFYSNQRKFLFWHIIVFFLWEPKETEKTTTYIVELKSVIFPILQKCFDLYFVQKWSDNLVVILNYFFLQQKFLFRHSIDFPLTWVMSQNAASITDIAPSWSVFLSDIFFENNIYEKKTNHICASFLNY